jgi:hypothetical protein
LIMPQAKWQHDMITHPNTNTPTQFGLYGY